MKTVEIERKLARIPPTYVQYLPQVQQYTDLTKLLWAEGEAVGMYTYTLDGSWGMPCMHVIAVRREYRRRGYGTRMVRDFLDSFPGEVGFESPNSVLCRLLVKLGAAEERDGGYYAKGRVSFMSSGM